jgi:hypothetical protein
MSTDLFFGKTKRNWSREPAASNPQYAAQMEASAQANKVARLTAIKAKADSGDKKAQKKWAKINKKVAKLHLKASKGDLKAAKQLAALTPTGLFVTTVGPKVLKTAMKGTFVGKDEILGTFVGKNSVTRVRGDDKLTEIVTSGGAFVGNDKLTEIITSGCAKSSGAFVGATMSYVDKSSVKLSDAAKQEVADAIEHLVIKVKSLDPTYPNRGTDTSNKAVAGDKKAIEIMSLNGAIQTLEGVKNGGQLVDFSTLDSQPLNDYIQAKAGKSAARSRIKKMSERAVKGGDLDAVKYVVHVKSYQLLADATADRPLARQATNQLLFSARQTSTTATSGALATEILGNDKLTEIITSGRFVGEEERALAAEGGACERAALNRRSRRTA